jgi:hypothetical protein
MVNTGAPESTGKQEAPGLAGLPSSSMAHWRTSAGHAIDAGNPNLDP